MLYQSTYMRWRRWWSLATIKRTGIWDEGYLCEYIWRSHVDPNDGIKIVSEICSSCYIYLIFLMCAFYIRLCEAIHRFAYRTKRIWWGAHVKHTHTWKHKSTFQNKRACSRFDRHGDSKIILSNCRSFSAVRSPEHWL